MKKIFIFVLILLVVVASFFAGYTVMKKDGLHEGKFGEPANAQSTTTSLKGFLQLGNKYDTIIELTGYDLSDSVGRKYLDVFTPRAYYIENYTASEISYMPPCIMSGLGYQDGHWWLTHEKRTNGEDYIYRCSIMDDDSLTIGSDINICTYNLSDSQYRHEKFRIFKANRNCYGTEKDRDVLLMFTTLDYLKTLGVYTSDLEEYSSYYRMFIE